MGADLGDGWESDNKNRPVKEKKEEIKPPEKHRLHLARERRRGKVVTIVKPFHLAKADLQALLKRLKRKLGTGGTMRGESLEFQGEIQEKLTPLLTTMGYRFK